MNVSPPKSSAIIEIERLGFAWHEESQYDLGQLDVKRRVQVRESEHYAPKVQVQQYATQMKETVFPPIVITRNAWIVDGNTRIGARNLLGLKFSAAIILDVEYGKGGKTDAQLEALAATLNQQGGQRLTTAETKVVARTLIDLGWKSEQINRSIGVKTSLATQLRREMAAEAKFTKVGFAGGKKLSATALRAFGIAEVLALNDVPYKQLAELALAANLSSVEIKELAKEMRNTGSDAGMIEMVAKSRADMEERIRQHDFEGNGRPPASSLLRRALGLVLKFEGNSQALVEKTPAAMKEHLDVVKRAAAVLSFVIESQEALIDA